MELSFRDTKELCSFYSCEGAAVSDFCDLVDLATLLYKFYPDQYTIFDLARAFMADLHYSPLVYYSRIKRAILPILSAEHSVLVALGLPEECEFDSVPRLAHALACVLKENVSDSDITIAAEVARRVDMLKLKGRE